MKIKRLALMGTLMVTLNMPLARAQVSSFRAAIPFSFVVGKQTLPAGTYLVQRFLRQAQKSG
jgi:hypothetical protein